MTVGKESKLSQKFGPISATAKKISQGNNPVGDVSSQNYQQYQNSTRIRSGLHQGGQPDRKVTQNSPTSHLENVELDDYDDETDEFAGYSGSQHQQNNENDISQTSKQSDKYHMASSQTSKKSSQQKLREKNIKEVKMYYWSKVDQGDTNEVYKILSYAKQ